MSSATNGSQWGNALWTRSSFFGVYMKTLREVLEQADTNAIALGHFNFSDLVTLKAIFQVARDLKASVIVGVSEGEREFIGTRQVAAVVKSLRDEYDFPIFLNADHTHSLHSAMEAAEAGYEWIVFDASNQPFEEIVAETPIDTLAPAVGNMHGMLRTMVIGETKKRLDIARIRAIKAETRIFMTLHGASGTDDGDLRRAIAAGITVIHINTELRLAWRRGFDTALAKEANEIVPYKILSQRGSESANHAICSDQEPRAVGAVGFASGPAGLRDSPHGPG
jgi:fructose-bisphosphate aldolase, class II